MAINVTTEVDTQASVINGVLTKLPIFYAPLEAGEEGQILTSTAGEPVWKNPGAAQIMPLNSFNGIPNYNVGLVDLYGPTKSGTPGQILESKGNTEPRWVDAPSKLSEFTDDLGEYPDHTHKYLEEEVEQEKERAIEAENVLSDRIDDEETARIEADNALDARITTEKEDRIAADDLLTVAIEKEADEREKADSKLAEDLEAEAVTREDKDTELQEAIELEITTRVSEDAKLKKMIEDAQAELSGRIDDEEEARIAADNDLEEEIALEKAERIAKDEELDGKISAEEDARIAGDKALEEALAEEATTRASEDVRVKDESKVTIAEQAGTGDILKKYIFTQDGNEIGVVNIARDLVVESGSVIEIEGVKYLRLIIANESTPVDIPVTDLVDLYYGDNEYVIVKDDNTITLTTSVKNSLALADTAVQPAKLEEVENGLKELVANEKKAREDADAAAESKHNADIAELKSADETLESSISAEKNERISAISAEETARTTAVDQLEAKKLDKSEIGEWTLAELKEIFGDTATGDAGSGTGSEGSGEDGELD